MDGGGLRLRAPGMPPIAVDPPGDETTTVKSHFGLPVPAADAGDRAAAWFSRLMGELALDEFGVGQDHVFSVDMLDEALPYALGVLQRDEDRWDGDAIVVLATADDIDEARAILEALTG